MQLKLHPSATAPTLMIDISLRSGDKSIKFRRTRAYAVQVDAELQLYWQCRIRFLDLTVAAELWASSIISQLLKLFVAAIVEADGSVQRLLSSRASRRTSFSFWNRPR